MALLVYCQKDYIMRTNLVTLHEASAPSCTSLASCTKQPKQKAKCNVQFQGMPEVQETGSVDAWHVWGVSGVGDPLHLTPESCIGRLRVCP